MNSNLKKIENKGSTLISYIRKEKKKEIIILSSDEEDKVIKKKKKKHDKHRKSKKKEGSKHNPIDLSSDESRRPSLSPVASAVSDPFIDTHLKIKQEITNSHEINALVSTELIPQEPSFTETNVDQPSLTLDQPDSSLPDQDIVMAEVSDLSPYQTDSIMSEFQDIQLDEPYFFKFFQDGDPVPEMKEIKDMDPPQQVHTFIPTHVEKLEVLRSIEIYLQSLSDPIKIPSFNQVSPDTTTRTSSRRVKHNQPQPQLSPILSEPNLPYVPTRAWYQSTWEDWAQLDRADILHVPFRSDEIRFIEYFVAKHAIKKKQRELIDFWQAVSANLVGRSPLDCRCFWMDYLDRIHTYHPKPMMIRKLKDVLHYPSILKNRLLSNRSYTGSRYRNELKKTTWATMSREHTVTEGSGDAITLAIFNEPTQGVKIAIGSLCDENIQYNVPGNLRLWTLDKNQCITLNGHQTRNEVTEQNIWRTVTDVKMSNDESFIFSASHDGSANVWRAKTGRLVSTLRYHSKPINQLAVNKSAQDHVLATCSNDGTATVWSIGRNGKTGSGVICELDLDFYSDPHVDCIEFGRHATDKLLFLGINNKDLDHPGYVEAYDIVSGKPRMRFDSMMGSVSTLAVSSSGRFVVSGNYNQFDNMTGDKFIHLHDSRHPSLASKFYSGHPDVNVVTISPCERFVASGNADKEKSEVVIFDVRFPKKPLHLLRHDQTLINQSLIAPDSSIGIGGLHWMSDSRTVVTGGGDSTVKIWNIEGATRLIKSYTTSNCVTSLYVHEDTMTMAAGVAGSQGVVHVWQP